MNAIVYESNGMWHVEDRLRRLPIAGSPFASEAEARRQAGFAVERQCEVDASRSALSANEIENCSYDPY